jgi:hypothetical protein
MIDEKEGIETIKITQSSHQTKKSLKRQSKGSLLDSVGDCTLSTCTQGTKRSEDLQSGNIPSREQFKNWAAWFKRNKFPSCDSLDNFTATLCISNMGEHPWGRETGTTSSVDQEALPLYCTVLLVEQRKGI